MRSSTSSICQIPELNTTNTVQLLPIEPNSENQHQIKTAWLATTMTTSLFNSHCRMTKSPNALEVQKADDGTTVTTASATAVHEQQMAKIPASNPSIPRISLWDNVRQLFDKMLSWSEQTCNIWSWFEQPMIKFIRQHQDKKMSQITERQSNQQSHECNATRRVSF